MAMLFRGMLGRWVANRDGATWVELFNGSMVHPLGYLHPSTWAPLCVVSRRFLVNPRKASALAAEHLWSDVESRRGKLVVPLDYALEQPALWQLVMCLTRRELLSLALWCGATTVRRRVAAAVDRQSAARWRTRLGNALYADVLGSGCMLGRCQHLPPARELASGRLLLDLGLSLLATWSSDAHGWAQRRIETAAGPHWKPVEHYLGPNALLPADAAAAEQAVFSFLERQCHAN